MAAFGSWETFRWITSHEEDAFVVNPAIRRLPVTGPIRRPSRAQFETETPGDSARHDIYTFGPALADFETARRRALYVALAETDDWAHEERYDRVLQMLERTDAWFKELWAWPQADP